MNADAGLDLNTSAGRFNAWLAKYLPIDNWENRAAGFGGKLLDTWILNNDELRIRTPESLIWTLEESEDSHGEDLVLSAGLWRRNRLGYFICGVPWSSSANPGPAVIDRPANIILERTFYLEQIHRQG